MSEWKRLKGFRTDAYEINRSGHIRVKNLVHKEFEIKDAIIKPVHYPSRGMVTILYLKGKKKIFLTAKLVAENFVKNPGNYIFVRHIDGNDQNVESSNLEWSKSHPDCLKAIRTKQSGLTEQKIKTIFRWIESGKSQAEIARHYGVSRSSISHIVAGRRWNLESIKSD